MPKIMLKKRLRGFALVLASIALCSLHYLIPVEWYWSLLPGAVVFALSLEDIFGIKSMQKYRRAFRVVATESGLTIRQFYGLEHRLYWPQVKVTRVEVGDGNIRSFGVSVLKGKLTLDLSDDLTNFSKLWSAVQSRGILEYKQSN